MGPLKFAVTYSCAHPSYITLQHAAHLQQWAPCSSRDGNFGQRSILGILSDLGKFFCKKKEMKVEGKSKKEKEKRKGEEERDGEGEKEK